METFNESIEVLKKYNKEPFHIEHSITVGLVFGWFAKKYGLSDEEVEHWKVVGLLHDIDFEMYPEKHCKKCIEILKNEGYEDEIIKSVCRHGYGICSDIEPSSDMEKVLYTVDELTGIIFAAAKMRPSKSCTDMELELDEVLNQTLDAMKENENKIRELVK